jgi:hypothetical protein
MLEKACGACVRRTCTYADILKASRNQATLQQASQFCLHVSLHPAYTERVIYECKYSATSYTRILLLHSRHSKI